MSTPPPNFEEEAKDIDNVSSGTRGRKPKESTRKRKFPPAADGAGGGNDEGVGGDTRSAPKSSDGPVLDKKLARMQREAQFRNLERDKAVLTKANASLLDQIAALQERVSVVERIRKKNPLPLTETQMEDGEMEEDEHDDGDSDVNAFDDNVDPDDSARDGKNRGTTKRSPGSNILSVQGNRAVNIHLDANKRKSLDSARFSNESMTQFINELEAAHRSNRYTPVETVVSLTSQAARLCHTVNLR